MEEKTDVIANIIAIRQKKGIKQAQLSLAITNNESTFSKIESRERELKVGELYKIASALGVRIIDLFYPNGMDVGQSAPRENLSITFQVPADKVDKFLDFIKTENLINKL